MASHTLTILSLVALLALHQPATHAATTSAPAPAAPADGPAVPADGPAAAADAPAPPRLTVTGVLKNSTQFDTFLRLLAETHVGDQIDNQLKDSYAGMTVLAPTDNAFNKLKPGTLNGLDPQEQTQLIQYHVLTKYYSLKSFETASNPINTQGSDETGTYTLNVTASGAGDQFNVSTGKSNTPLGPALRDSFPLAVYQVDAVLLPPSLFGAKPKRTKAPSPEASVDGKTAPSNPAAAVKSTSAAGEVRPPGGWRRSIFATGLVAVAMFVWS